MQLAVTVLVDLLEPRAMAGTELDPSDPRGSLYQQQVFRTRLRWAVGLMLAVGNMVLGMVALNVLGLVHRGPNMVLVAIVPIFLSVAFIVAEAWRTGQLSVRHRDDDRYWRTVKSM